MTLLPIDRDPSDPAGSNPPAPTQSATGTPPPSSTLYTPPKWTPAGTGFQVRVYSTLGKRKRLAASKIGSVSWTDERYGGFADFSIDLNAEFSQLPYIVAQDIVEFWYQGQLRYRGSVSQRVRTEGDPSKLTISGYGRSYTIGRYVSQKRYIQTTGSEDVSILFRKVCQDTVTPLEPSTLISAKTVGQVQNQLDAYNQKLKDVFDTLAKSAANRCVWGVDVITDSLDPSAGHDRLYMRPVDTASRWTVMVPGRNTVRAESNEDTAQIVNALYITGGTPTYPNLIYNGSFERPVFSGAGVGNLLRSGDFEDGNNWSLYGGASYKATGHLEGNAYSGNVMIECDHIGEGFSQTNNSSGGIVIGDDYTFSVHCRQEAGTDSWKGRVTLEWHNSSGTVLQTDIMDETVICPVGATWQYFAKVSRPPAGTTGWKLDCRATQGGGNGLLFDAAQLYDNALVAQDGWATYAYGDAAVLAQNWAYPDSIHGGYSTYLKVQASDANSHDIHLAPKDDAKFDATPRESINFTAWFKSPPGITSNGKMFLEVHQYKSDGSASGSSPSKYTIPAGSGWSTWTQYCSTVTLNSDCSKVECYITFRGPTEVLVDGLCCRDSAAGLEYIPDGPYQTTLYASSVMPAGSLEAASQATYGLRPAIVSESSITTTADAITYAQAYFAALALPNQAPVIELVDDPRPFRPGDGVRVAGNDGGPLTALQMVNIARVRGQFNGESLSITLETETEVPDEADWILEMIQQKLNLQGTGSMGSAATGSSQGSGPGQVLNAPSYWGLTARTDTDPTLHDAYTPAGGPHVLSGERTSWTGAAQEVSDSHTSTAKSTTYGSLDARLEAIETSGGVPAGTADGQTLRWASSSSAYVANSALLNLGTALKATVPLTIATGGSGLPAGGGVALSAFEGYGLDYLTLTSGTANTGIAINCSPNGTPSGLAFDFQFNTSSGAGPGLYIVGRNDQHKIVFASGASSSGGTAYPLVFRCGTNTWDVLPDAMTLNTDGTLTATYRSADGSAGITGTSGGGDTVKNGLITAFGSGGSGGSYSLPAATSSTLGGVKVGSGLNITTDGTLSATATSGTSNPISATNSSLPLTHTEGGYQVAIIDAPITASSNPYTAANTYTIPYPAADFTASSGYFIGTCVIEVVNVSGVTITVNTPAQPTRDFLRPVQARPYPADVSSITLTDGQTVKLWVSTALTAGHGLWYYRISSSGGGAVMVD